MHTCTPAQAKAAPYTMFEIVDATHDYSMEAIQGDYVDIEDEYNREVRYIRV
jgi:hypothetical protein